MSAHLSIGSRVAGTYLGHCVSGAVKSIETATVGGARRYWVVLDEPVDVAKSEHMTNMRQNIHMTLDDEGHTVNHKGLRDDIAHIWAL
jgi:hypothetical protein